jgi:hypothetical protein
MRSLISTHTILGVRPGEFVSLLDPPEAFREAAAGCRNIGISGLPPSAKPIEEKASFSLSVR